MIDIDPTLVHRVCAGRVLRFMRRRGKHKQWALSETLEVSQPAYSKYERGAVPLPVDVLCRLAAYMEESPSQIVKYSNHLASIALAEDSGFEEWAKTPKTLAQWCDTALVEWDKPETEEEDDAEAEAEAEAEDADD